MKPRFHLGRQLISHLARELPFVLECGAVTIGSPTGVNTRWRFSKPCVLSTYDLTLARKCMEHGAEKQFSGVRSGTERDHISPRAKRNRHRRIAKNARRHSRVRQAQAAWPVWLHSNRRSGAEASLHLRWVGHRRMLYFEGLLTCFGGSLLCELWCCDVSSMETGTVSDW